MAEPEEGLRAMVREVVEEFANRLQNRYYMGNEREIEEHIDWIVELVHDAV